jgi:phosphomevalonate kinase
VDSNHFVETTLNYVLSYITAVDKTRRAHGFQPASLVILADNDYYSKPKQAAERPSSSSSGGDILPRPAPEEHASSNSSSTIRAEDGPSSTSKAEKLPRPRFRHFGTTLREAHKTGLGSSAALVTSLAAALLSHYLPASLFDLATAQGKRVLHNLAQIAHCSAQGKIGSGFDVASAVYGSCLYRRFSPSLLSGLPNPGEPGFAAALAELVDGGEWDCEIQKDEVGLPPDVAIRMCDVDCGTQTVSMVKKVHAWRDGNPQVAAGAYQDLQSKVDDLARVLREGRTEQIGAVMRPFRGLMRKLGQDSGVPIEPESQEVMLDAVEKLDGVYGSVVPGAGGYDAAAVVMKDDAETEKKVRGFLREWSAQHEIQVRLMMVKGETDGVRKEDVREFKPWTH